MKKNLEKEREYARLDTEYWTTEPKPHTVRFKACVPRDKAQSYYDNIEQSQTQYEYDWRIERALAHMHTAVTIAKETTHDDDSE